MYLNDTSIRLYTGSFVYVKISARTNQGIANFTASEAEKIAGSNPDYATQESFLTSPSLSPPSPPYICVSIWNTKYRKLMRVLFKIHVGSFREN